MIGVDDAFEFVIEHRSVRLIILNLLYEIRGHEIIRVIRDARPELIRFIHFVRKDDRDPVRNRECKGSRHLDLNMIIILGHETPDEIGL